MDSRFFREAEDVDAGHHDLPCNPFFERDDRKDDFLFCRIEVRAEFALLKKLVDLVSNFKCWPPFFCHFSRKEVFHDLKEWSGERGAHQKIAGADRREAN